MNSVLHELGPLKIKSNFVEKSIYKPQKPSLYFGMCFLQTFLAFLY